MQKNKKRAARKQKAARKGAAAARPADGDRVLGPAAGVDGMEEEGCGARVCLEVGAGEGEGEPEGDGKVVRLGVPGDGDFDMDALCEGMRALPAPSRVHFGRRREAGEMLWNEGCGERASGLQRLVA